MKMDCIGDKNHFAVEVGVNPISSRRLSESFGCFRLWVAGGAFGVDAPDATCLANSRDWLSERRSRRGQHISRWLESLSPEELLSTLRFDVWGPGGSMDNPEPTLLELNRQLIMAPDGDQAFDDGSYVAHLDMGNKVRLVAAKHLALDLELDQEVQSTREDYCRADRWDSLTVRDISLSADWFYGVIDDTLDWFDNKFE